VLKKYYLEVILDLTKGPPPFGYEKRRKGRGVIR